MIHYSYEVSAGSKYPKDIEINFVNKFTAQHRATFYVTKSHLHSVYHGTVTYSNKRKNKMRINWPPLKISLKTLRKSVFGFDIYLVGP